MRITQDPYISHSFQGSGHRHIGRAVQPCEIRLLVVFVLRCGHQLGPWRRAIETGGTSRAASPGRDSGGAVAIPRSPDRRPQPQCKSDTVKRCGIARISAAPSVTDAFQGPVTHGGDANFLSSRGQLPGTNVPVAPGTDALDPGWHLCGQIPLQ